MKLSAALLLAPFVLLTSAAPNPATADKVAAISEAITVSPDARASVTGTVNANYVRYRRCARTSCEAVGQYQQGQRITITCRVQGETINGWPWWDKLSNGYYISDYYVDWTGGVPSVC